MKDYQIKIMDLATKKQLHTYTSKLVPIKDDVISKSDNEVFIVESRMLPANDNSNVILLFCRKL